MADFGGMGGYKDGRPLNTKDGFEMAVVKVLGERMKADDGVCRDMWSALANQDWVNANGDTAGYSFRAAGDLVAAVSGKGDYMTWYCSGPDAYVSQEIEDALSKEGWTPDEMTA